jgi:pyruvate dehydrogenase E1 component
MQTAASLPQAVLDRRSALALAPDAAPPLAALEQIQRRVLWLATRMIHEANSVRPNHDGTKVGGHQASSASMVTIMTALYFHFLREGDRVSVKPHASPVLHAINYLLGQLPQPYLTSLRAFGGLQAYPSRTKDPDPVDFSTGSVGLGAVAPTFAALAHHYARSHFEGVAARRFVSLIGDAELDEGNIWEAILDPALEGIENVLWIVDLNRQSLDRVVPGVRAANLKQLFATANWQVLEAKYGRRLQSLMAQPHGHLLRQRIDEMSNEEYQTLIRLPGAQIRPRLIQLHGAPNADLAALLAPIEDAGLPSLLSNLGGHDFEELFTMLAQAEHEPSRPAVLFAYTIKGWGLPIAGHPLNHSMLLSDAQVDALRQSFEIAPEAIWDAFAPDTPEGRVCAAAAKRLYPVSKQPPVLLAHSAIPEHVGLASSGTSGTQEAFGRVLVRLADLPELRQRLVTTAPDVSISTNLAGWINKTGVFAALEAPEYEGESQMLMRWRRGPGGQHIELGISEMNLFMLLGMFGLSAEINGQQLIPIGTVYDPFVCRGLDALIYGLYSGAKFIFAGTPSGITLSPEGGAHQSTITASIGMELPNLHAYEPCFAQEVEWIMLEALRGCCDRLQGRSTYLRLSTRPIDQALLAPVQERIGMAALRRQVIDGGYRLLEGRAATDRDAPVIQIAVSGALVPEAVAAARYLQREGVAANVLNLTSPRRLYERWQAARRADHGGALDWLIAPEERRAPIITVQDAASHALAWLGSVHGAPVTALGVDRFGQSGARDDLYQYAGVDSESIVDAAFAQVDQLI